MTRCVCCRSGKLRLGLLLKTPVYETDSERRFGCVDHDLMMVVVLLLLLLVLVMMMMMMMMMLIVVVVMVMEISTPLT